MCVVCAVVTFLKDAKDLRYVDPAFRPLAAYFHCIPSCATFGVSCAGHFEVDQETFWPKIIGSLRIIVVPREPHITLLLKRIQQMVGGFPDVSFAKMQHVFGPPLGNPAEVWEIRIGDAGCLAPLGQDYYFENLPIAENRGVFEAARARHEQVELFWGQLAKEV